MLRWGLIASWKNGEHRLTKGRWAVSERAALIPSCRNFPKSGGASRAGSPAWPSCTRRYIGMGWKSFESNAVPNPRVYSGIPEFDDDRALYGSTRRGVQRLETVIAGRGTVSLPVRSTDQWRHEFFRASRAMRGRSIPQSWTVTRHCPRGTDRPPLVALRLEGSSINSTKRSSVLTAEE